MKLSSYALTDPGRVHAANEDFFLANDERGLYVVSDGVGMYRGAAVASRCVVETVSEQLRSEPSKRPEERRQWLLGAVKKAAAALAARSKADKSLTNMSATLTLLQVIADEALLVHIGDSRAYLYRDGRLSQLTRDHSLAFEQYEAGAITKDALRTHPNQKLLTRTLRASSTIVLPEFAARPILPGDRYLLCTDGLTKELTDELVAQVIATATSLSETCGALVERANQVGAHDNVTVVMVAAE